MYSVQSRISNPAQADFSAALERAGASGKPSGAYRTENAALAQPFEAFDPYHNRNLSSVIARITDDGPARLQNNDDRHQKRPIPSDRNAGATAEAAGNSASRAAATDDGRAPAAAQSFALDDEDDSEVIDWGGQNSGGEWQLFVVLPLIAVIAVMGFILYQLMLQTDKLNDALRLNEEQIRLVNDTRTLPSDVLPGLDGLGLALAELKAELQVLKAGRTDPGSVPISTATAELQPKPAPQPVPVADSGERGGTMPDKPDARHQPVDGIGQADHVERAGQAAEREGVSQAQKPVLSAKALGTWSVNLASLTSKDKAQAAYDRLLPSGALPLIKEVIVNNRKVYRISVDGFASREAASAFVAEAKEKYGFDGGWIRQH